MLSFSADVFFTFRVKGIVNNKLTVENLMVAQTELAEAVRDPAQTFASGMRIAWMRIGRSYNSAQQNKRRIAQAVRFQNRIERNVLSVMTEFAIWNVKYDTVVDLRPVGVARKKNKFGLRIDEMPD